MQPNIVMIVADQLHAGALGCMGNEVIQTPHIDALAGNGARFDTAYCQAPVCMASRCSFNTGLYPHTLGVHDNPVQLPRGYTTLAQRLARQGYDTAGIGHIGGDGVERGFRHKIDLWDPPLRQCFMDEMDALLPGDTLYPMHHSGGHPLPQRRQFDYTAAQCAKDYINEVTRPFFLQLDFYGPHAPWFVSEPYASMYDPADIALPRNWRDALKDKPSTMRAIRRATRMEDLDEETFRRALAFYYGKISYIDALTGQVLDALKSRDLLDSSIVVFMGDHGDFAGEFGLFGKNGLLYDALTHVPLIIHAPQQVQNAVQVSTPVAHVDLVPTLLSMAGMDVPRELPGRDLTPVMAGDQDAAQAHGPVFCSSHGTLDPTLPYDCAWEEENLTPLPFDPYSTGPVQGWTSVMVRDGAYKCIAYSNGFRELFDMHNDPWERTNLSGREDYRAIETTLMHRLLSWQMDTWKPQIPQQGLPYHFRSFCRRRIPVSFQPLWDAWQAAHANG